MTNEKSIYGNENNFPTVNSCQFILRGWGGGQLAQILGRYVPWQNQKVDPITRAKFFIEKPPKTYENDMNLLIFLDLTYNPCKMSNFALFKGKMSNFFLFYL